VSQVLPGGIDVNKRIEKLSEIRSTIDLIMERTQGMSLSRNEKEEIRKQDFRKKAKGLRRRLLDNPAGSDEILEAIHKETQEDKRLLEAMLWDEIVRDMPNNMQIFQHLDVLEKMPRSPVIARILKEAYASLKAATKTGAKDKKKILTREKKKLAAFGISGSAVTPKLPSDSYTDEGFAKTVEACRRDLLEHLVPIT
jgi:hypothetical protein